MTPAGTPAQRRQVRGVVSGSLPYSPTHRDPLNYRGLTKLLQRARLPQLFRTFNAFLSATHDTTSSTITLGQQGRITPGPTKTSQDKPWTSALETRRPAEAEAAPRAPNGIPATGTTRVTGGAAAHPTTETGETRTGTRKTGTSSGGTRTGAATGRGARDTGRERESPRTAGLGGRTSGGTMTGRGAADHGVTGSGAIGQRRGTGRLLGISLRGPRRRRRSPRLRRHGPRGR